MAFKMKYKNLEEVVKQLQGAVKAHGNQAKVIKQHIKEMKGGSPKNFNRKLRDASAKGKLDDSPEFKAAVDNAPTNMSAYKKNHDKKKKKINAKNILTSFGNQVKKVSDTVGRGAGRLKKAFKEGYQDQSLSKKLKQKK